MTVGLRLDQVWTADEFMIADQEAFGNAWRYELVDGRIVAHARARRHRLGARGKR